MALGSSYSFHFCIKPNSSLFLTCLPHWWGLYEECVLKSLIFFSHLFLYKFQNKSGVFLWNAPKQTLSIKVSAAMYFIRENNRLLRKTWLEDLLAPCVIGLSSKKESGWHVHRLSVDNCHYIYNNGVKKKSQKKNTILIYGSANSHGPANTEQWSHVQRLKLPSGEWNQSPAPCW